MVGLIDDRQQQTKPTQTSFFRQACGALLKLVRLISEPV
jgi:hypothetical protein